MRVAILSLPDSRLVTIAGTIEMLWQAYSSMAPGNPEPIEIELIGLDKSLLHFDPSFYLQSTSTITDNLKVDSVIVPAMDMDIAKSLERSKDFIPWLQKQYQESKATFYSQCNGTFLLAAAGLLDGKKCTTHWMFADLFKDMFPRVELLEDEVAVFDGRFGTSGGAVSSLKLVLQLIEQWRGSETAKYISELMLLDPDKSPPAYFSKFTGYNNHNDKAILESQLFIEKNYRRSMNIKDLAKAVSLSERTYIRRFKKATHQTPTQYIQKVRIEVGKEHLATRKKSVEQIMRQTGYTDPKSYRNLFRKHTGLTPLEYRRKFNASMVA